MPHALIQVRASDFDAVSLIYQRMVRIAPIQLSLSLFLMPGNRHELARALQCQLAIAVGAGGRRISRASDLEVEAAAAEDEAAAVVAEPESQGASSADSSAGQLEANGRECVICMDYTALVILAPCGHKCACAVCAVDLSLCPLCRAPVQCVVGMVWEQGS